MEKFLNAAIKLRIRYLRNACHCNMMNSHTTYTISKSCLDIRNNTCITDFFLCETRDGAKMTAWMNFKKPIEKLQTHKYQPIF